MSRAICLIVSLFALGCAPESDGATEEDLALLRELSPGITQECVDAAKKDGIVSLPRDVRECFAMDDSKLWAGLWLDEFEGSRFCAEPSDRCTSNTNGQGVWLTFADEIKDTARPDRYATDELYEIEFIGRLTSETGSFGHMGLSQKEIVVEELIRIERVPET